MRKARSNGKTTRARVYARIDEGLHSRLTVHCRRTNVLITEAVEAGLRLWLREQIANQKERVK